MKLLALETSSSVAGAAVYSDGVILAEESRDGTLMHATTMLPMAERVLAAAGVAMSEIDCFAVNVGPGSFTGIRIGVSAVNAMAFANGRPVVGVDSFSALCANIMGALPLVCSLIDAGGNRVYAALLDNSGDFPKVIGEMQLIAVGELAQFLPEGETVALIGGGAQAYCEELKSVVNVKMLDASLCSLKASSLANIAVKMYESGLCAAEAKPIYIAIPQAERMLGNAKR